jgi:hypothetical protein
MKEYRGFMSGLNGMFNCALEFWRETIRSSMFRGKQLHCYGNFGKKMGF